MTPEEKKLQLITRLEFGAVQTSYSVILRATLEFHLN